MDEEPRDERELAEEQAAADEAGSIGGDAGMTDVPPEEQAPREGGQGEQEGFEVAEDDLVESASHGDPAGVPEHETITGEVESDRAGAAYGEGDEEDSTAVTRDPDPETGADDPGEGPGITTER
jgi:hypothetical protein